MSNRVKSPPINKPSDTGVAALDLSSWRFDQELKHSPEPSNKPNPVWVIKNSKDGRFIASGSQDGSIKIWTLLSDPLNTNSKAARKRSPTADDHDKSPGKRMSKFDLRKIIFDTNPFQKFSGHTSAITDLSWSFSHYFLLSASLDQTVRLWNISNSQCLCVFYHADVVTSVKFHPLEHHLFLSGAFDGRIRTWSILEKKVIHWNQVPNNSITAVEITPDGNTAIAGTLNGDILFYGWPYLKYETEITITPPFRALRLSRSRVLYKINGIESFVDFNSGENMMVVNSTDSKTRIYQIRDKSLCKSFKGNICQTSLFRPSVSNNGMILISPSEDKSICFWKNTEDNTANPSGVLLSKQPLMERLMVDEQVLCAQFASPKIYFWKNSFSNSVAGDTVQGDLQEPLILLTSDIAGRICVYTNAVSSAALTVRSFKDIGLSQHSLVNLRKKSNSPSELPRSLTVPSPSVKNPFLFKSNSRDSPPEIKITPSSPLTSSRPSSPLISTHSSKAESIISVKPVRSLSAQILPEKHLKMIGILFFFSSTLYLCLSENNIDPPIAKIKPEYIKVQNFTFVDNYSWLKNYYDSEVKEYLGLENAYSTFVLSKSKYKKLQDEIKQELDHAEKKDVIKIWEYGSWTYYVSQGSDLKYPRYYRQRINDCRFFPSNLDYLILDYNLLILTDEAYFMEGFFEVSEDGSLLAFGYDLQGNEEFLLRIWDLETQTEIQIPEIFTYYSVRWFSINNRTWIYYNVVDHGIPHIIRRLCVRNCEKENGSEFVYEESDLSMTVELKLSADSKYLFIKSSGLISSEYLLVMQNRLLVSFIRDSNTIYDMDHHNNSLIIRVNDPPYINYRIVKIPIDRILKSKKPYSILELESLSPVNLFAGSSKFIELHEVFNGWIALWVRKDGLREIIVLGMFSGASDAYTISFRIENDASSESYAVFPGSVDDMESRIYRSYYSSCLTFTNSSFSREPTMYWYNFKTRKTIAQNVQRLYPEYLEKRVWIQSSSSKNVRIPVSLVSLKNLYKHNRPTVISSYGSYGSFKDPIFNSDLFPLLDRGMVFALCHPRGDGDLGAKWYLDGKYENKINTFRDTQDCIDGLISMNITSIGKVGLMTRSAGGLIAGYAINHPRNISVIVTQVPFIDPIGDMIDENVPWTSYEFSEWGNPEKNASILAAMLDYSPYHNIKSREYPAIMVTAGIKDSRVPFWEPTKFVAKLRASNIWTKNLILKVNEEGHFSNSKNELVEIYSFLLIHTGYKN